jgi:rubrerythrin
MSGAMLMPLSEILMAALDDEWHAEATYAAIIDRFGPVRPFINIIEAERRHAEAILQQLQRLGIAVPANRWSRADVPAPDTFADACEQAIAAEIENVALYDRLLPQIDDPAARHVLERLQAASRERHLPAFRRCLARQKWG